MISDALRVVGYPRGRARGASHAHERCQYGWKSESQRITAHEDFIAHLRSAGNVMFLAENEALDFVRARALARIERDAGRSYEFRVLAGRHP